MLVDRMLLEDRVFPVQEMDAEGHLRGLGLGLALGVEVPKSGTMSALDCWLRLTWTFLVCSAAELCE